MHRDEDGRPLEVKEGILLDQDNQPIAGTEPPFGQGPFGSGPRVRVIRLGGGHPFLGLLLLILLPVFLIAGFTFFAVAAAVVFLLLAIRRLFFR